MALALVGRPHPRVASGSSFGSSKPAGADTVFPSGQVFASVGNSTSTSTTRRRATQVTTLNDGTGELYTLGSAFDSSGNLYVTDDLNGDDQRVLPERTALPDVRLGADQPASPSSSTTSGNLYVGQQGTPYIAEFNSSGQRLPDFGPVTTGRDR